MTKTGVSVSVVRLVAKYANSPASYFDALLPSSVVAFTFFTVRSGIGAITTIFRVSSKSYPVPDDFAVIV